MKKTTFCIVLMTISLVFWSCQKKESSNTAEQNVSLEENISVSKEDVSISEEFITPEESWENFDWLTEYSWSIEDGRELVIPYADHIYFHFSPYGEIRKLEIPPESALYQNRLRREFFTLYYQTAGELDKLYLLENTFENGVFDLIFENNFSRLSLIKNNVHYGRQDRVGEQVNPEYPLVGIWGILPYLTEYRLVDPADCLYYFEIDREIPGWAVRRGTYLLRQTGDNVFETVSSFSDGCLRLEIRNEKLLLLTPLFTLSDDEKGMVEPLALRRSLKRSGQETIEDEYWW